MLAEFPLTVLLAIVSVPPLKTPPPSPAVLPLRVQLLIVKIALFSLSMPPPVVPAWAFLIVNPEIATFSPEEGIRKTRLELLPSIASRSAPGPLIVTLVLTSNSPLLRLITPEMPVASIVSPSFAIDRAWRIEPGPLSFVLVTTTTVACAESVSAQANVRQNATPWILITLLMTIKSERIVNATNVTVLSLARKRRSIRPADGIELATIALHR